MKRPNVLLISIDTLRADHLSCYGYGRTTTPNLDALAADGVLFENAYSTAGWTPPAHASMLTGCYPSTHRAIDDNRLRKSVPTMAEIFQRNGYRTAGFVNNSQVGELVGLERGHETFVEVWKGTAGRSVIERGMKYVARSLREWVGRNDHGADLTNRLAGRWMRQNKRDPFYMFIHYIEPHNPLDAPYPYKYQYWDSRNRRLVDREKVFRAAYNPLICFTDDLKLSDEEIVALIALYDGEIAYMDRKIGELIAFLKKEDLYDSTMIVITADHGEHFGEHGLYSHVASLYEEILHIPLIIKFPEAFRTGPRASGLVQLVDIFSTAVDVAKLQPTPVGAQGRSLLHERPVYHESIVAEWEGRIPSFVMKRINGRPLNETIAGFQEAKTMIRERNYKYILSTGGLEELYDLERDRRESVNIAASQKQVAADLKKKLTAWQIAHKAGETEGRASTDEATRRNLESLGYL